MGGAGGLHGAREAGRGRPGAVEQGGRPLQAPGGRKGAPGPAPLADSPPGGWADLPRKVVETVARAVPAGDRLWFRLVCKSWAAAGVEGIFF